MMSYEHDNNEENLILKVNNIEKYFRYTQERDRLKQRQKARKGILQEEVCFKRHFICFKQGRTIGIVGRNGCGKAHYSK